MAVRRATRAALAALMLAAAPAAAGPVTAKSVTTKSATPGDVRLLPAAPRYARNPTCADVQVVVPARRPDTHRLDGLISPDPADQPMGQGDSAICFAYAAADMISQRVGVTVSALDVATRYYFTDPARLAAHPDPAVRAHLRRHPRAIGEIASARNDTDISRDGNPRAIPYFDKLEDGQEDAAALLYNVDGLCTDRDLPSHDGYAQHARLLARLRYRAGLHRPNASPRALSALPAKLREPRADAFNAAWLAHVAQACRRRPLPVPLLPISHRIADNQLDFMDRLARGRPPSPAESGRLLAMIDYALDHGRTPTVGYSWYLLQDRDPKDPDLAADHASTLLGRRRRDGVCQYHLQDNTGEYCARMRPGIAERCESGRVWVREDELSPSLYGVIYLR